MHSAALILEDFERLASAGASMVWSPTSNYLLYRDTADVEAAKQSGIRWRLARIGRPAGRRTCSGS